MRNKKENNLISITFNMINVKIDSNVPAIQTLVDLMKKSNIGMSRIWVFLNNSEILPSEIISHKFSDGDDIKVFTKMPVYVRINWDKD